MDIHIAVQEGLLNVVLNWINSPKNDVNQKDGFGWTLLHTALANRKYDIAICLLNHPDISVHSITRDTTTPLHYAVKSFEDEKYEKLVDVLQLLVDRGAFLNSQQKSGFTPLHEVCARGNVIIAEWLINKGANINIQNKYGDTPLHVCAKTGQLLAATLLIEKGANVNIFNLEGKKSYQVASTKEIYYLIYGFSDESQTELQDEENNLWSSYSAAFSYQKHLTNMENATHDNNNINNNNNNNNISNNDNLSQSPLSTSIISSEYQDDANQNAEIRRSSSSSKGSVSTTPPSVQSLPGSPTTYKDLVDHESSNLIDSFNNTKIEDAKKEEEGARLVKVSTHSSNQFILDFRRIIKDSNAITKEVLSDLLRYYNPAVLSLLLIQILEITSSPLLALMIQNEDELNNSTQSSTTTNTSISLSSSSSSSTILSLHPPDLPSPSSEQTQPVMINHVNNNNIFMSNESDSSSNRVVKENEKLCVHWSSRPFIPINSTAIEWDCYQYCIVMQVLSFTSYSNRLILIDKLYNQPNDTILNSVRNRCKYICTLLEKSSLILHSISYIPRIITEFMKTVDYFSKLFASTKSKFEWRSVFSSSNLLKFHLLSPRKPKYIISFGNRHFSTMIRLMHGIEIIMNSLASNNSQTIRKVLPDKKTKVESYYSHLFLLLRNSFDISEEFHLSALGISSFLIRFLLFMNYSTYGQTPSGKLFYSSDEKIIIHEIAKSEFEVIKSIIDAYQKYILKKPQSFLPRLIGLYRLCNEDRYFITQKNMLGIHAKVKQYIFNPLLFNTKNHNKIDLGFQRKALLIEQIEQDALFLRNNGIVNYDFLVRVHKPLGVRSPSSTSSSSAATQLVKSASTSSNQIYYQSSSSFPLRSQRLSSSQDFGSVNTESSIPFSSSPKPLLEISRKHSFQRERYVYKSDSNISVNPSPDLQFPGEKGITLSDGKIYYFGIVNVTRTQSALSTKKDPEPYNRKFIRMVHDLFC